MTFTEFEILQLLAQNPGRVFSKEQIYDIVWNEAVICGLTPEKACNIKEFAA